MRSKRVPTVALLVAASGCVAASQDDLETRTGPIVAGTLDTGDPSIIEIIALQGTSGCSWTSAAAR